MISLSRGVEGTVIAGEDASEASETNVDDVEKVDVAADSLPKFGIRGRFRLLDRRQTDEMGTRKSITYLSFNSAPRPLVTVSMRL